jgi:negative regulator of flagellin synthesis FlgM
MTDQISSYAKSSRSDAAMRASVGKADKQDKTASAAPAPEPSRAPEGRRSDSVQMSNVAQKAMSEPDFDRAKVESIKQAISEGNYPLDVKRIAESFVAIERMINA